MTTAETFYAPSERGSSRRSSAAYLDAVSRYLVGRIPAVTAETLAVARIVFGSCFLYFWLYSSSINSLSSVAQSGATRPGGQFIDQSGLLTLLSASLEIRAVIYWSIAGLLLAFIAGAFSRILYPALVLMFWLANVLQNNGHNATPLMLALLVTVPAPWSERWSVDSLIWRRRSRPRVASAYYGYAIWLVGLVIGITYAAAGLSKLVKTEGAWLWETGARNGFIQDFGIAATDWGMVLANNYLLALGASIMSAFGQAAYVYSSFTRSAWIKYAIAFFVAIPFLAGLVLFMGHFWWQWAILVLMLYLPWKLIDRRLVGDRVPVIPFAGSPQLDRHRRWFLTVTTLLIGIHAYAVVTQREVEPLFSSYNMYADRMLAGSRTEAKFWERYKTKQRHFKFAIQVIGQDKKTGAQSVRDLQNYYHIAQNLHQFALWKTLDVYRLHPADVLSGNPISPSFCTELQSIARSYAPADSEVNAIRFAKRYVDIVYGRMVWVPVKNWVKVDLTKAGCPHQQVAETSVTGGLY